MPARKEAVEQRRSHLAAVVLADTFQQVSGVGQPRSAPAAAWGGNRGPRCPWG